MWRFLMTVLWCLGNIVFVVLFCLFGCWLFGWVVLFGGEIVFNFLSFFFLLLLFQSFFFFEFKRLFFGKCPSRTIPPEPLPPKILINKAVL